MSDRLPLFVYGTLQHEDVQRGVFGRVPGQRRGVLDGFRRGEIAIADPAAAARLGSPYYFTLEPDPAGRVDGVVLELDASELASVDAYERRDAYVRVGVRLASGELSSVYVHEGSEARRLLDAPGDLRAILERALPLLRALADADTARCPAPGTWCPREIVGHLVDSATVNHDRFLRARWQDDLVFDGYDQDAWVVAHGYAAADWMELLDLWRALNLHVARVMEASPGPVRTTVHTRHTLDRIAFNPVRPEDPVTLDLLMRDYVAHLRHHLAQVLGAEWERPSVPGVER